MTSVGSREVRQSGLISNADPETVADNVYSVGSLTLETMEPSSPTVSKEVFD